MKNETPSIKVHVQFINCKSGRWMTIVSEEIWFAPIALIDGKAECPQLSKWLQEYCPKGDWRVSGLENTAVSGMDMVIDLKYGQDKTAYDMNVNPTTRKMRENMMREILHA